MRYVATSECMANSRCHMKASCQFRSCVHRNKELFLRARGTKRRADSFVNSSVYFKLCVFVSRWKFEKLTRWLAALDSGSNDIRERVTVDFQQRSNNVFWDTQAWSEHKEIKFWFFQFSASLFRKITFFRTKSFILYIYIYICVCVTDLLRISFDPIWQSPSNT
jgi:hypothetical protein